MPRNPQPLNMLRQLFTIDSQPVMLRTLFRQPSRQPTASRTFLTSNLSSSSRRLTFPRWRANNSSNKNLGRRHESTNKPTSSLNPPPGTKVHYQAPSSTNAPKQSLSDRMKAMSKKYGWTVVGIYLGLSALDFPFCFLAVRWFGPERIGHLEHVIVSHVWAGLESVVPGLKEKRERNEQLALEEGGVLGDAVQAVNNVKEEVKGKEGSASIWTQLLIAYGVHKSLFFLRIPITLAITPKVVKTLRGWGWKIGNVTPKA